MLKSFVLLHVFLESMIFFLAFIDEKKVQKNSIYLEYFVTFWISLLSLYQFNAPLLNKC